MVYFKYLDEVFYKDFKNAAQNLEDYIVKNEGKTVENTDIANILQEIVEKSRFYTLYVELNINVDRLKILILLKNKKFLNLLLTNIFIYVRISSHQEIMVGSS